MWHRFRGSCRVIERVDHCTWACGLDVWQNRTIDSASFATAHADFLPAVHCLVYWHFSRAGEAAAATSAHAAQALAAAADATATTASAAATAAQQQEQQQQGFAAAGKAAAEAVAAAASGADKGLQEAAGQVAEVGHSGVEAGREAAEKVVSGGWK